MTFQQLVEKSLWLLTWLSFASTPGNAIIKIPCPPKCECEFTRIYCHNKKLQDVPVGWWPHTWILSLGRNKIQTLEEKDLDRFRSLRLLDIYGNKLRILNLSALSGSPQLTSVVASNNLIHKILPHSQPLVHLERLDLSYNLLTSLPLIVLKVAPNLVMLRVSNNALITLEPMEHPNLRYLDLSSTMLTKVPDDIFSGLPLLEELIVSNNSLTTLGASVSNMKHLKQLDLSGNRFKQVNKSNLPQFSSLQKLSLSYNPLQELSPKQLKNSLMWRGASNSVPNNATSNVFLINTPAVCNCRLDNLRKWSGHTNVALWTLCYGRETLWCRDFDVLLSNRLELVTIRTEEDGEDNLGLNL